MKIRTRLALWCSGILLASLILMLGVLYYELVFERRGDGRQEDTPEQIADILLFYGLPTALVLVIGAWWFMRRAMEPVTELTQTVERIHADNLRERLARSGNRDELDRLTTVFNDMMTRLEDSFSRIREFTIHASHELKTPLTVMRGEVETLLRANDCTPTQREALAGHLDEIQRLTQIVDNLALLAKADAGLVTLAQDDVRLGELVREAYDDARILGESQRLKVELDRCEQIAVRGDRDRLRQLLLNLAENATKYNQPDGEVKFSLYREIDHAVIAISNTGPGISPEQLSRVFDRFFRGDVALKSRQDGCGLGLSIAQWIVSAHGGTVAIRSESGSLTTVSVRLPSQR
ncbi:MAG: HAMP domain-containing histidine kinase [Verrucomicrobiales bacterium]|nr:HAMP domain-containing histidine kinase [Verrucomicrobiales bacterium]